MLTANHDHRSNANAAATATAALNDVDALAAGESSTLSLAPPLDARAVRLARKQARKSKQQQQRRNSASAARSIPTTAARDTQRAWTLLPWRRRAVVDDDDSLELASAAEAQDEQLVALATSTESMPHPYVSASAAASNDVDESQSAVSTSTTTAGVEPHSSLTVPAAGTSPISADARWETLFDTIRPLFSRSIVPSRKMTSASGGQGSRVTSPTSPTSPNSPVEHTTTQSPPPIAPLQLAPPQVLVMEHHDESTPVTPSTPNTIRSKKLSRRATIDTSSIFATLRRQRTPAMSPETPVATTPELDEEALTELPETAVTANDTNSSNGSAMNEESATSSLDRRKTVFFVEPSAPVTSEPSMYKSLPRTLFASSRHRRRSSLQLPESAAASRSQTASNTGYRDRFKETVEKIRQFSVPSTLLRRRAASGLERQMVSDPLPLMRSALTVPFYAIARDENGRKGVPVILEAVHLQFRDDDGEEGTAGKSEQQQHHQQFHIHVTYGEMSWTVRRTFVDFLRLHSLLNIRHLQGRLPSIPNFPSQWNYAMEKAKLFTRFSARATASGADDLLSKDFLMARAMRQRRKAMEEYMNAVLVACNMRLANEVCTFLEISASTLSRDLGYKGKEGYIRQRSAPKAISPCLPTTYHSWNWQWLVVRDNYIAFFDGIEQRHPRDVFLIQENTRVKKVESRKRETLLHNHYAFVLINDQREIQIRTESLRQLNEWMADINRVIKASAWTIPHRFNSFAPVRLHGQARAFVDGEDYFKHAADAIMIAKDTIYIQGWWLSPEVYLKRPASRHPEYRLDRLLKRKAEEGVSIYVIVYKEVSYTLSNNSAHTKAVLQGLHPSIRVLRFPDHAPGGVLLWALHDKLLVVDDDVAFVGGIDLCMGRYDTTAHHIGDSAGLPCEAWPGMDYSNPRIKDFQNVEQYHLDLLDKTITARMPWHDVHCMITGQAARDVARHFVQRWNFIKQSKYRDRDGMLFLLPPSQLSDTEVQQRLRPELPTCRLQMLRSVSHWSMGADREMSIYDAYMHAIGSAVHYIYIENQFFVSSIDETPGGFAVRNQIARAVCDAIIRAHQDGRRFRVFIVIPLLPAFEAEVSHVNAATTRLIVHWHQQTMSKNESWNMLDYLRGAGVDPAEHLSFCSLRTHGPLGVSPFSSEMAVVTPAGDEEDVVGGASMTRPLVTEQVYVHSKMMIVDDRLTIIGSANINDRSMVGNRDGELAVIIEDEETVPSRMGGLPYNAGRFALELRLRLFREHLGIDEDDVEEEEMIRDPLSETFFRELWSERARHNTSIYRDVFRCYPDDSITDWAAYERFVGRSARPPAGHVVIQAPMDMVRERLNEVRGNLVVHPLRFLSDENLAAVFPAKEFMMPMDAFV